MPSNPPGKVVVVLTRDAAKAVAMLIAHAEPEVFAWGRVYDIFRAALARPEGEVWEGWEHRSPHALAVYPMLIPDGDTTLHPVLVVPKEES